MALCDFSVELWEKKYLHRDTLRGTEWHTEGYFILDIASIKASTDAVIISVLAENP